MKLLIALNVNFHVIVEGSLNCVKLNFVILVIIFTLGLRLNYTRKNGLCP